MIKVVLAIALFLFAYLIFPFYAFAVFDPLSRPNNFYGIHILSPSELGEAANLVNSKNGAWGYVTIPIQAGDKDLVKWQNFMDEAKRLKLIPIIRLATEASPQNSSVWSKPTKTDILDFANFLNSLNWPIQNRYVIIFNEVNRFDEWGGEAPNPAEYTDLLNYAVDVFKQRSPDFYIISAGLDNAAPNDQVKYMDNFVFLNKMIAHQSDIFNKVDGFASHSYPNPGFSQPPLGNQLEGITTYQYEYRFINAHSSHKVPAFITETGWDSKKLGEDLVAKYYKIAYDNFWNKDKDKIVAITPFLLNSQGGSFDVFSFVQNGKDTAYFTQAKDMTKTKGEPLVQAVEGIVTKKALDLQTKVFKGDATNNHLFKNFVLDYVKFFF